MDSVNAAKSRKRRIEKKRAEEIYYSKMVKSSQKTNYYSYKDTG